jgi:hypothetical protein
MTATTVFDGAPEVGWVQEVSYPTRVRGNDSTCEGGWRGDEPRRAGAAVVGDGSRIDGRGYTARGGVLPLALPLPGWLARQPHPAGRLGHPRRDLGQVDAEGGVPLHRGQDAEGGVPLHRGQLEFGGF